MKLELRTVVLLIASLLLLVFAGLNWAAFTEPTDLRLAFTTIRAPLGLTMLAVVGFLTLFYGLVMAKYQTQVLLERAHAAKDLDKARALAEKAEVSRFQELREFLGQELGEIRKAQTEILEQSERAAVDLAETVLDRTSERAGGEGD